LPVNLRDAVAGLLDHGTERLCGGRQDLHGAAPIVPHLSGAVAGTHEFRRLEHSRGAVGKLEVEPTADGEHHVGVAHNRAAHCTDDRWVAVGHEATALTGV
jgi:hypothetical protein